MPQERQNIIVKKEELMLKVNEENMSFSIYSPMENMPKNEECHLINSLNFEVEENKGKKEEISKKLA